MKKILVIIILLMTLLTPCTGIDSRRIEKVLNNSDCLYNEELGIEFNSLYSPGFISGYITDNNVKLAVIIF